MAIALTEVSLAARSWRVVTLPRVNPAVRATREGIEGA